MVHTLDGNNTAREIGDCSMRVVDYFDKRAEAHPHRPFLIDDERKFSYKSVQVSSHKIARALLQRNLTLGARIVAFTHNSAVALECLIGCLRAGCIWTPANVRNAFDDTVHIVRNTEASVLFYSAHYTDDVKKLAGVCPSLKYFISLDGADGFGLPLADILQEYGEDTVVECPAGMNDVATLMNSGGTTGSPKGVMMAHAGWASLIANIHSQNYHPAPVHLVAAPITHAAGGTILAMLSMATTNVILPGFEPVTVMQAIERYGVTHLFLPPTAIYRMLAHPDVGKYDYSSLRYFTYAGAPMSPAKVEEAISVFGPVMTTAFGQTESGLNVTYFPPEEHVQALKSGNHARLLSCGKASDFVRVEIMNDEGRLLPPGEAGEIVLRGNQVMRGYWNNEDETRRAQAFGWHHTGDIGYKDDEGWVFLVDRKRDMIISGGFNIFPSEIEKTILSHPAVQDCAVIGAPDSEWGEAVTAVLQFKEGTEANEAQLRAFCRERLGGMKTPKRFVFWADLPRSPVGKVLRRKVREFFWQDQDRKI